MKLILVLLLIPSVFAAITSYKYIPPQSIGAGMMSSGAHIQVIHQYIPPQSIGAGMMTRGHIIEKVVPPPSPVIQALIDIAAFPHGGQH